MTALGGEIPALARAVLALAAVLGLLLGTRWLLARRGLPGAATTGTGPRVVAALNLDARNRIVVLQHGERELLLAVGPGGIARLDGPAACRASDAAGPGCRP
jgi:flagellar biogenesis protein FliO